MRIQTVCGDPLQRVWAENRPHECGHYQRPAFTLIELIVVIAIIAILAALTTGAVMRYYSVQQQTNTETTIRKVYGVFERQWQAVIDDANKEPLPPSSPVLAQAYFNPNFPGTPGALPGALQIAGGDPARARIIWIKLRLKQAFPMSFDEVLNPIIMPGLPTYQTALLPLVQPPPQYQPPLSYPPNQYQWPSWDQQSSALLLLALTQARGGLVLKPEDLGPDVIQDVIPPPPPTGLLPLPPGLLQLKQISDAWKKPLVLFRWPTGNSEIDSLNPAAPGSLQFSFRDPQDPNGLLLSPSWWNANHTAAMNGSYPFESIFYALFIISPYAPSDTRNVPSDPNYAVLGPYSAFIPPFGSLLQPAPYDPYYVVPHTYYSVPVIASSGPNKSFGLLPPQPGLPNPMASDKSGDDNDNIYSYRLRLGARGD
jgi:prepilin-type N-terminal cleavage/methylation domain-containing protein